VSPQRAERFTPTTRRLPRWLRERRWANRSGTVRRGSDATTRFRRRVAILIAVASIAGVLSAWRAAVTAGEASGYQHQGLQHLVHRVQEQNKNESLRDQDRRLESLYEQHVAARRIFLEQEGKIGNRAPRLRERLLLRSREHLTIARSLHRFFLTYTPPPPPDEIGDIEDVLRERETSRPIYFEDDLEELRPAHLFREAADTHSVAQNLSGITAMFAVALFLLTLAELARSSVRRYFAVSGAGAVLIGLAAFAVVLLGST
jgi:hypothetical protein